MSNELTVNNNQEVVLDGSDFVADLTSAVTAFSSLPTTTEEEKKVAYNVINNPQHRLSEAINLTLPITDVYAEIVECHDENGEVQKAPRIVLVDEKGEGYQCVSLGIFSAIKKAFQIFGVPHWEKPIKFEVKQITKGNKSLLTLNIK